MYGDGRANVTHDARRIRAVIFDIGGVLEIGQDGSEPTSSIAAWLGAWDARLGLGAGETEKRYRMAHARLLARGKDGRIGTCTEAEWHAELAETCDLDASAFEEFLRDFWNSYLGVLNEQLAKYFGALRPRVKTALLSNSFLGARMEEEKRYAFSKLADLAVYSHEEGMAKPDARIYQITCERLGVAPDETIFVDDKQAYLDGAAAVGMHVILHRDTSGTIQRIEEALRSVALEPR